jgi:hypothetical protein
MPFSSGGRDPERVKRVAALLTQLWTRYPQLRLGQLLCNVDARFISNPFSLEDDEIEASLRKILDKGGFGG